MKIKNTKTDILLNIAAVACLAAVTLYLLVRWSQIPMTIPGHYTADGQIDSWTARTTLWQLPVLGFQWHPERQSYGLRRADAPGAEALFAYFAALIGGEPWTDPCGS